VKKRYLVTRQDQPIANVEHGKVRAWFDEHPDSSGYAILDVTSVTHVFCPSSPRVNGEPTQTHYMIQRGVPGASCKFCGRSRVDLAKENDLP
jgi:hypothetical protein